MTGRSKLLFMVILLIFILAALVVFPMEKGVLGNRGVRLGLDLQGGVHVVYRADLSSVGAGGESSAIEGVISVLENRVNPLGVTEPVIQRQGVDRIIVQLPGKVITDREKESLARVAVLEFGELVSENETFKWENRLGKWKPATAIIDGQEKELTSRYFKENTFVDRDDLGRVRLIFEWDAEGSKISEAVTGRLLQKPLGIFEGNEALLGENGQPIAPTVQAVIKDKGEITGLSANEALRLSQQLNAGRLPVPLEKIYDQTVSPILGANFAELSVKGGLSAIGVIMLFLIIYYRVSGAMASLALIYYGVLLLAIFKLFNVTLSLAGIGGFILSVGMAIDANVLIFERMKEEFWAGRGLGGAIDAGFKRAWTAIWDSNITTILAGLILLWLSTGVAASAPVRGFALTLIIGVAASMFTAITVTRTLLRPFVGSTLAQNPSLFAPYQRKRNA
ncbi:MAG: protein translocase subunit SecD [Chloroflexi bacterium]|nr:protein translocase subunit SecD [Chloroflexota bacterium]